MLHSLVIFLLKINTSRDKVVARIPRTPAGTNKQGPKKKLSKFPLQSLDLAVDLGILGNNCCRNSSR